MIPTRNGAFQVHPKPMLLLPPKPLASCIAAAIVRDTRGGGLTAVDRFNYFPASPLVSVTIILQGELRLISEFGDVSAARTAPPTPSIFALPPQDHPTASWSPSDVHAVTIGFYPDAWAKLWGGIPVGVVPDALISALQAFTCSTAEGAGWAAFCDEILPLWVQRRTEGDLPDWQGSDRLADWAYHLFARLAQSGSGRSLRTLERRLRRWTGRSRQHLDHFVAVEDLHRRVVSDPDVSLAALATEAGFSDQSHMGRAVRRTTGFSPARLNRLIETEEAFWCYRLLGERF